MKRSYFGPILLAFAVCMTVIDISAQIQRRNGSKAPVRIENTTPSQANLKTSTSKKTPSKQVSAKASVGQNHRKSLTSKDESAYVISYEADDAVFTDILPDVNVGDYISISDSKECFIHPVTGEQIVREDGTVGILVVDQIFSSYMKCHPVGESVDPSWVGSRIKKSEEESVVNNYDRQQIPLQVNRQTNHEKSIKELFEMMMANEQAALPVNYNKYIRLEPFTIEGDTLYKNMVYLRKKFFEKESKNKTKIFSGKVLEDISKTPFFLTAKEVGYKVVLRHYNPNKTSMFEIELP